MSGTTVERALLALPDATRDDARAAIGWLLPEDDDEWDDLLQLTAGIPVVLAADEVAH